MNNSANEWQQLFSSDGRGPLVRSVPTLWQCLCIDVQPEQFLLIITFIFWKWVHGPPQPPLSLFLSCIGLLPLLPVYFRDFLYSIRCMSVSFSSGCSVMRCGVVTKTTPCSADKENSNSTTWLRGGGGMCIVIMLLCVCLHACKRIKALTTFLSPPAQVCNCEERHGNAHTLCSCPHAVFFNRWTDQYSPAFGKHFGASVCIMPWRKQAFWRNCFLKM